MEAAGFVDIQIHHRSFDHGNWREGASLFFIGTDVLSGEPPARAAASRACPDAFPGSAFAYVVENLFGEYIPDLEERKAFATKLQERFDGTGQATFHMYLPSICCSILMVLELTW